VKEVFIHTETINLDQFLKWAGLVSTGGEAKIAISQGNVKVNGEVETRRSRKLKINDVVEYEGNSLIVARR